MPTKSTTTTNKNWSPDEQAHYEELKQWVEDGWYDHCLVELHELVKQRMSKSLHVGQMVTIQVPGGSSFAYAYHGKLAQVVKVNAKTVRLKVSMPSGSPHGHCVTVSHQFAKPVA